LRREEKYCYGRLEWEGERFWRLGDFESIQHWVYFDWRSYSFLVVIQQFDFAALRHGSIICVWGYSVFVGLELAMPARDVGPKKSGFYILLVTAGFLLWNVEIGVWWV